MSTQCHRLESRTLFAFVDLGGGVFNFFDGSNAPTGPLVIGQGDIVAPPTTFLPGQDSSIPPPDVDLNVRFELPLLNDNGRLNVFGTDDAETFTLDLTTGVDTNSTLASIIYTDAVDSPAGTAVFGSTSVGVSRLVSGETARVLVDALATMQSTADSLLANISMLTAFGSAAAAAQLQDSLNTILSGIEQLQTSIDALETLEASIASDPFIRVTRSDGYQAYVAQSLFSSINVDAGAGDDVIDLRNARSGISVSINGGDGNDVLHGGAGITQMTGGAGNDTMYGRGPVGVADGGTGTDTFIGSLSPGWVIRNTENVVNTANASTNGRRAMTMGMLLNFTESSRIQVREAVLNSRAQPLIVGNT